MIKAAIAALRSILSARNGQVQRSNELTVHIGDDGIPAYDSPYIRKRKKHGDDLLLKLINPSIQLSFDEIIRQRPMFPHCVCFNVHTYCNEACIMCPHDEHYSSNSHQKMPLGIFRALMQELVQTGEHVVTFNNFSDIFAHKDGLSYVTTVLNEFPQVALYLVTNGIALDHDVIDQLISSGFDGIIYVSCHAFSPETFKVVTKRNSFERVKNNITYLASKHPFPKRIIVQYATDYSNKDELRLADEYWHSIGVTINHFSTHTFAGNSPHRHQGVRKGRLSGCRGWGSDAGQPFHQMVIQPNGDVSLCCHDLTGKVLLGNVLTNGISGVWNGEKFKRVISDIYTGQPDDPNLICRKCSLAQYKHAEKEMELS